MQVTDDIVQRACAAFQDSEGQVNPACGYWSCMRRALVAVLGDIPESGDHIETLERKVVAADITIRELEEQLATQLARADKQHHRAMDAEEQLKQARDAAAAGPTTLALAPRIVEAQLRALEVTEIRLWGAPWRTSLSGNVASVTLTLRRGDAEVHGETLEDAIGKAMKEQGGA